MTWLLIIGSGLALFVLAVTIPAALAYALTFMLTRWVKPKD